MKKYENRHKKKQETAVSTSGSDSPQESHWKRLEVQEGASSVHVSVTLGHSEAFGKKKFSVTVGHTVSCVQSPAHKSEALEEAKSFCIEHVEGLRREVRATMFPEDFTTGSEK